MAPDELKGGVRLLRIDALALEMEMLAPGDGSFLMKWRWVRLVYSHLLVIIISWAMGMGGTEVHGLHMPGAPNKEVGLRYKILIQRNRAQGN